MDSGSLKRLTPAQVETYRTKGYLAGFRIFDEAGVARNLREFDRLTSQLKPDQKTSDINCWEQHDPYLWSLASNPVIADYVEDVLGPNFFLWSTHFFCKYPGDGTSVAWHQDAKYWPLRPHKSVTVWLAFDDSDAGNGAMKVVPGTQRLGILEHEDSRANNNVLWLAVTPDQFDESKAEFITLRAGEISLHDDNLVHGSDPNTSTRRRAGLTMRYSATDVKCDLRVWGHFKCRMVRGVDAFQHNPTW